MADAGHLEKMGRELKCPICLSLFKSAASLGCNHVFCNSCIVTSMKSGLNCPVCKVPYRRREVRPAPHMDNLVSIYKNMEIASGVSIFVTQNPSSAKSADEDKKDSNCGSLLVEVPGQDVPLDQCKTYKRGSIKAQASDLRDRLLRPSCPTKKRIQVPQHPPFTAPTRIGNPNGGSVVVDGTKAKNGSDAISQKMEQVFQPFFWLREDEDDADKGSQYSDKDQLTDSSPIKTPCFSDIKDAEDEVAANSMAEDCSTIRNPLELYDRELFEWTQRPCYPELCSSPLGNQLAEATRKNVEDNSYGSCADEGCDVVRLGDAADNAKPTEVPSQVNESNFTRSTMSKKRGRKAGAKLPRKHVCANTNQPDAIHSAKVITSISHSMPTCDRVCEENLDEVNRTSILEVPETQEDSNATGGTTRKFLITRKNVDDAKKRICATGQEGLGHRKRGRCSSSVVSKADGVGDNKKELPSAEAPCNASITILSTSTSSDKSSNLCTKRVLQKCGTVYHVVQCAFCHSPECSEASGEMVTYKDGILEAEGCHGGSKAIHVHKNCAEWAPNVYFDGDRAVNLDAELARSRRITCSCCGIKGAALGCFERSCRKSFHVTCAKLMPQCRWDNVNFVMLCPLHASSELPIETSRSHVEDAEKSCSSKLKMKVPHDNVTKRDHEESSRNWSQRKSCNKMVLCCSSLTNPEWEMVAEFGKVSRVSVLTKWNLSVTHVIASQDENRACKRTLKVLMGILEGKWILSIDWIQACIKAKAHVDEKQYEIALDTHGMKNGPRLGRLRVLNRKPKLFEGMEFYFTGDFVPSYKGYLQELVTAAGGIVLHRKPIPGVENKMRFRGSKTLIIYSLEVPEDCETASERADIINRRLWGAEALASSTAAKVATNLWLLDSIAAHKLRPL
ncbi:hypothetical protein MLD38_010351 [Melastoma candidum]|uniref:Uncharacterized protein n=1 Tax=Melastoma candidum TaxID=119954 RepID=A0ACB9QZK4_9MYRT|nr:hypothetical protein MLD38_010351 [Melastoma candidum]